MVRPCLRLSALTIGLAAGCAPAAAGDRAASEEAVTSADQLKVGTWNLEFFGRVGLGPEDEGLQVANAATVIGREAPDVLGLQEISEPARFDELRQKLPAYDGFTVVDPRVAGGAAVYGPDAFIRPAILFRRDRVTFVSAKVVRDIDWGRPPLEVALSVTTNPATGEHMDLVVLVVHFVPFAEHYAWTRRKATGDRLKAYLDASHPGDKVVVVGDFNDDVDTSILEGYPSPYEQLRDDPARYTFTTKALSFFGQGTTTGWPSTIDHHLATNELAARFVRASAWVERAAYIHDYRRTTSDHYPVFTRYWLTPPPP
jgi:endonuclease/exonuclease/phosphatase family metal-dependent hydrolase